MCYARLIGSVTKSKLSRQSPFAAAQQRELMAVIAISAQTKARATVLLVPEDARFLIEKGAQ